MRLVDPPRFSRFRGILQEQEPTHIRRPGILPESRIQERDDALPDLFPLIIFLRGGS